MSTTIGELPAELCLRRPALYNITYGPGESHPAQSFEQAGPREKVFFEPDETTAAMVTCGCAPPQQCRPLGCFYELNQNYGGSAEILGIRYGSHGLNPAIAEPPIPLRRFRR